MHIRCLLYIPAPCTRFLYVVYKALFSQHKMYINFPQLSLCFQVQIMIYAIIIFILNFLFIFQFSCIKIYSTCYIFKYKSQYTALKRIRFACCFVVSFKIWKCKFFNIVLFQDCFDYLGPLASSYESENWFYISGKRPLTFWQGLHGICKSVYA